MALRYLKPTTPGRRGMVSQDTAAITTTKPVKSLLRPLKKTGGRNHRGVITSRRRGGGARRHYRVISWKLPPDFEAVVKEIEYDPNRSAHLARLQTPDQRYHYILAPKGVVPGDKITVGPKAPIKDGNRLPLANIPIGSLIHNLELQPGRGGQLVRGAGLSARLVAKDGQLAQVRLPSGEVRLIPLKAQASLGALGNEQHQNIKLGKAGRRRHLGRRPKVRGVAMNAADHPHGGGEGKGKNYKAPTSPWGQQTLGHRTRSKRKSTKLILKSRHLAKRRRG